MMFIGEPGFRLTLLKSTISGHGGEGTQTELTINEISPSHLLYPLNDKRVHRSHVRHLFVFLTPWSPMDDAMV